MQDVTRSEMERVEGGFLFLAGLAAGVVIGLAMGEC
jgi:hypothetical protein